MRARFFLCTRFSKGAAGLFFRSRGLTSGRLRGESRRERERESTYTRVENDSDVFSLFSGIGVMTRRFFTRVFFFFIAGILTG